MSLPVALGVAFLAAGLIFFIALWVREWLAHRQTRRAAAVFRKAAEGRDGRQSQEIRAMQLEINRLSPYGVVADADAEAKRLAAIGEQTLIEAKEQAAELRRQAGGMVSTAEAQAAGIIAAANRRAEEIAGSAYEVVRNVEKYERTAAAMRNIIEGYGDRYLVPAESLLDDLAEEVGHKEAGQQLKWAREWTRRMVKEGKAAVCEYVEPGRREMAERFVTDAFNGKVDSILSRVKHDNFGTLEQEIKDAFVMVNHGGAPFRNARVREEYLGARRAELKWAAAAQELKRLEQEEQRRIRDQIREEERAQREFEKAQREAAKEEDLLRKAMAKAQAQFAAAGAEQKAEYEARLQDLQAQLAAAEEKNQRAISMAQQTRRGHVYIISNEGSFGPGVYKIGLTRRLDPMDRIWELGDASVPFDFDVHAIILAEDAPALELKLHKHFLLRQINKVNHRKEFFRAVLSEIRAEIEGLGIEAKWTMAAEAKEWRETQAIERLIAEDPAAKERWVNRQLTLDPVGWGERAGEEATHRV